MNEPLEPVIQRPRRRKLWFLLLSLFLLMAAGAGYLIYLSYSAKSRLGRIVDQLDREDPGWRLEDIQAARPRIPDEQNSALVILAAEKLKPPSWPNQIKMENALQDLAPETQLSAYQLAVLKREFQHIEAAVVEARKLKDLPRGNFQIAYSIDWISTLLPHVQKGREVANLLRYDALVRAQDGDTDGALDSGKGILNGGRAMADDASLISQLVRIACRAIALRSMERSLAEGQGSKETLRSVQNLLQDEENSGALLRAARGERAGSNQLMRAIASGNVSPTAFGVTGLTTGITVIDSLVGQNTWLFMGSLKTNEAAILEFMTRFVDIARLPVEQREPLMKQLQADAASMPMLARMLAPAVGKVAEASCRSRADLRCAIVAMALERYRLEHGRWPDGLVALVPAYLPEVPLDPYDGKPIRYRRLGNRIVVYSIGADKQDNDGNIDTKRYNTPGTDIGFRLWDVNKRRQPPLDPVVGPPRPVGKAE